MSEIEPEEEVERRERFTRYEYDTCNMKSKIYHSERSEDSP